MKNRLKIARLSVKGVMGVEESVIDLDTITVLEGKNASGKSSMLTALRTALGLERTSLARLARIDPACESEPDVEVLLVGDEREVKVRRRGEGSPEVRERVGDDWRVVPRPVEFLHGLIDRASNPATWLSLKDEDKAAALLEAMPLPGYSRAEALMQAGLPDFRLPPIPAGLHPLEDLEQVEEAVFSSRTEVNRQERAEHDAAAKLLAGLPAEAPQDSAALVADLESNTASLAEAIARDEQAATSAYEAQCRTAADAFRIEEEKVRGSFQTDAAKLRAKHEQIAAEIRAEAERRIAADKATTDAAVDALRDGGEVHLSEEEDRKQAAIAAADKALGEARGSIELRKRSLQVDREKLVELRATQQSIDTDRHVRATAEEGKARARQLEARAAALTKALEALKRYKLQLASSLPIKGLAVHFDEKGRKSLTLDGVPLDQVNKGRQAEIAVEVSILRGGPPAGDRPYLPLVLLDDAEKLDPVTRAALFREVAARGSQVIAAVVTRTPLQVLRGEAAVAEPAAARG